MMTTKQEQVLPDEVILYNFRCPSCEDTMHPPIKQCEVGHSFCINCNNRMLDCSYCQSRVGDVRNFDLEKLHDKILLPCNNRERDCMFISEDDSIVEHGSIFPFQDRLVEITSAALSSGSATTGKKNGFLVEDISQSFAALPPQSLVDRVREFTTERYAKLFVAVFSSPNLGNDNHSEFEFSENNHRDPDPLYTLSNAVN